MKKKKKKKKKKTTPTLPKNQNRKTVTAVKMVDALKMVPKILARRNDRRGI